MEPFSTQVVANLILKALSPDELRRLISGVEQLVYLEKELPGESVSWQELAFETTALLQRHAMTEPFLRALREVRPERAKEVDKLLGEGTTTPQSKPPPPVPPPETSEPVSENPAPAPRYTAALNDELDGPDALSLSDEIHALAQLIMAKSTQAPLAIGLFGDWGSGKSFFMKKLSERCDGIAAQHKASQDETFCDSVVQVRFNAWHYLDTQLWPPLVTTIFDELAKVANGKETHEEYRRRLLANLESNKQLREDATKAVEDAETEVALVRARLAVVEERRQTIPIELGDVVLLTVDEWLKKDETNEKFRQAFKDAGEKLGLEDGLLASTLDASGTILEEAKNTSESGAALVREVFNFRREFWTLKTAAAALLVVLVLPLGLDWLLGSLISAVLATDNLAVFPAVTSFVFGVTGKLSHAGEQIGVLRGALGRAQAAVDTLRSQKSAEEIRLQAELEQKETELAALLEEERLANEKVAKAREELQAINSGRMLLEFLNARAESDDYRSQQGIISMIREDFAQLSTLLRRHRAEDRNKLIAPPPAPPAPKAAESPVEDADPEAPAAVSPPSEPEVVEEMPQIDRIILYIDDLDRCPPDRVVEVLQAVHLLLAFDLFVVVVGVDTRWLLRALAVRYPAFMGQDRPVTTPQNYLEKIFQLPLRLRPIDKDGFKAMVGALTTAAAAGDVTPGGEADATDAEEATDTTGEVVVAGERVPEPVAPEVMELDPDEVKLLGRFHQFIDTPRLVKRFVNIYRFLRVLMHLSASSEAGPAQKSTRMLLLAVLVGRHEVGTAILKAIRATPDSADASFGDLLRDLWPVWEVDVGGETQRVERGTKSYAFDSAGRLTEMPDDVVPKRALTPEGVPLSAASRRRICRTLAAIEALLAKEESLRGVGWKDWQDASEAVFRFSAME